MFSLTAEVRRVSDFPDRKCRNRSAEELCRPSEPMFARESKLSDNQCFRVLGRLLNNRFHAKVSRPVTVEQVADFSFVDKARKDLGLIR